jgi:hypothetical protein
MKEQLPLDDFELEARNLAERFTMHPSAGVFDRINAEINPAVIDLNPGIKKGIRHLYIPAIAAMLALGAGLAILQPWNSADQDPGRSHSISAKNEQAEKQQVPVAGSELQKTEAANEVAHNPEPSQSTAVVSTFEKSPESIIPVKKDQENPLAEVPVKEPAPIYPDNNKNVEPLVNPEPPKPVQLVENSRKGKALANAKDKSAVTPKADKQKEDEEEIADGGTSEEIVKGLNTELPDLSSGGYPIPESRAQIRAKKKAEEKARALKSRWSVSAYATTLGYANEAVQPDTTTYTNKSQFPGFGTMANGSAYRQLPASGSTSGMKVQYRLFRRMGVSLGLAFTRRNQGYVEISPVLLTGATAPSTVIFYNYKYLEIPVNFHYRVSGLRWSVNLSAGASYARLRSIETNYNSPFTVNTMVEDMNISGTTYTRNNYVLLSEINVGYRVGTNFEIYTGLVTRKSLNSFTSASEAKPFAAGFVGGLKFRI